MVRWSSSDVQCVFLSEALEVPQGRTDGKEVSGWWTRWRISSKDIVEKLKEKLVIHDDVLKKSVRERELKGNLLVKSLSP